MFSPNLSVSGLRHQAGPICSSYSINNAVRACHQDETETRSKSWLKGLDDWWMVLYCFYSFPCSHNQVSDCVLLLATRGDTKPFEGRKKLSVQVDIPSYVLVYGCNLCKLKRRFEKSDVF